MLLLIQSKVLLNFYGISSKLKYHKDIVPVCGLVTLQSLPVVSCSAQAAAVSQENVCTQPWSVYKNCGSESCQNNTFQH